MLIYNNLIINWKSKQFVPFHLNLVSGRRRLLSSDEIPIIKKILAGEQFDEQMQGFFEKLIQEKQFITDEGRKKIEDSLERVGYWEKRKRYAEDYRFSIELTRSCNMNCQFCYAALRHETQPMTEEKIDAIFSFYQKYTDSPGKIDSTPIIRITGGEPLVNEETARLIQYIADKWRQAKLLLFTNGVNLLKYYHLLPLERIEEVHVSLDGPAEIHMRHRYSRPVPDYAIYENILKGIERLIADHVNVKVKTLVDRYNYLHIPELRQLLRERSILDSCYCEQLVGITLDYENRYEIMDRVNDIQDISKIESYLRTLGIPCSTYPNASILQQMMSRLENSPYMPKCTRCKFELLSNYFFSCDGEVYLCDMIGDEYGVLGSYYPEAELDFNAVEALYNRTIFSDPKCAKCTYKFVCLGGCPHSANAKKEKMNCSIFSNEEILDNLEFDYSMIVQRRYQEKWHETN